MDGPLGPVIRFGLPLSTPPHKRPLWNQHHRRLIFTGSLAGRRNDSPADRAEKEHHGGKETHGVLMALLLYKDEGIRPDPDIKCSRKLFLLSQS